ncbi:MAG: hypothetical protein ACJ8C4_21715 [Gemmataceae bacterium]
MAAKKGPVRKAVRAVTDAVEEYIAKPAAKLVGAMRGKKVSRLKKKADRFAAKADRVAERMNPRGAASKGRSGGSKSRKSAKSKSKSKR